MKKKEMHIRVEYRKEREKNIAVVIEESAPKAFTKKKTPDGIKKSIGE